MKSGTRKMPYTFRKSDLPVLDLEVQRGADIDDWCATWQSYRRLSGLKDEPALTQVDALTQCLTAGSLRILRNLGLTDDQLADAAIIVERLKCYARGQLNESVERRNFRNRMQQPGETVNDYMVELRNLVRTCNFCGDTCTEKALRDQLIEGLHDSEVVEDLLKVQELTLATAINNARASESAKKNLANISDGAAIQAMKSTYKQNKNTPPSDCEKCGHSRHRKPFRCPAEDRACHICGEQGHFQRVCRSEKPVNRQRSFVGTSARRSSAQMAYANKTFQTAL